MHSPRQSSGPQGCLSLGPSNVGSFPSCKVRDLFLKGQFGAFFTAFGEYLLRTYFLGVAQRLRFRWHCGETRFRAPFNSMETAVEPCHRCPYQERGERRGAPRQAPHACPPGVVCGTTEGPEARVQMPMPPCLPSSLREQVGAPASYWD